ncbi:MAG: DNA replication/repair protein RecF [Sphingomonas sp.]|nr:DNA replication/repair protein RecF [Sphingomonas sp.]RZV49570.1 MAG: DNA replication/repair protein RecF [Sphingomonadaceae bacterium]
MLTRLALTDFRNHADALIEPGPGFVLLSGDNGAGKTNILEAVSLLAPGRGLRGTPLRDMARQQGDGGFAVAARLADEVAIGVGTAPAAPDRKKVRIKGEAAAANRLGDYLAVLWLTPAMDRLFADSAGARRRFLDRLVLALEPSHAHHVSRYEAAMRARNKLLAEPDTADAEWLAALENGMAEHGEALGQARARTIAALGDAIAASPADDFPHASLALSGWDGGNLKAALRDSRSRDGAAGRTLVGPHRQDLAVHHAAKNQPAHLSSTGEQKGLLIGLLLAHAALVEDRRGAPPVLLLDEVAAHLDPVRRAALFARLEGYGQVWMTATEAALFDGIDDATRLTIAAGQIS